MPPVIAGYAAIFGSLSEPLVFKDARGLRYEIDPPDTTAGRDVVELIRRRDVPYSSFAFTVRKGGDSWQREGSQLVRELRAVTLLDVSPVVKPAYLDTEAALRSLKLSSARRMLASPNERMQMRLELAERV